MALTIARLIAAQIMIAVPQLQGPIVCQSLKNRNEVGIERGPMNSLGLTFIVAFECR